MINVTWSPDGQYLASLVWGHGSGEIRIYRADGQLMGRFDLPSTLQIAVSWAPDSQRIAVFHGALSIIGLDGRTLQAIPLPGGNTFGLPTPVSWSSDGQTLALVGRDPFGGDGAALWLAAADGSGTSLLVPASSGESIRGAAFSPDGQRIVYTVVAAPKQAGDDQTGWKTIDSRRARRDLDGPGRRRVVPADRDGRDT